MLSLLLAVGVGTTAEVADAPRYIDAVVSVGAKDLPTVRYCLRHMMRYVSNLHTIYVVTVDGTQARSVVAQANAHAPFSAAHTDVAAAAHVGDRFTHRGDRVRPGEKHVGGLGGALSGGGL